MHPYIKPFVEIIPHDEGMLFQGKEDVVVIKGKSIYKWFMAIKPFLNGQISLEKITDLLNESQKQLLLKIIDPLIKANFIIDYSQIKPHNLTENEIHLYSEEIGYLESLTHSPEYSFQSYRRAKILILSPLQYSPFTIRALLNTGSQRIDYKIIGPSYEENGFYKSKLSEYLEEYKKINPDFMVINKSADIDYSDYDAIVFVKNLNDKVDSAFQPPNCKHIIPCTITSDTAYIGPISKNHKINYDHLIERISKEQINIDNKVDENELINILISNSIAFEVFRYLAGVHDYSDNNAVKIDLNTLEQKEVLINNFYTAPKSFEEEVHVVKSIDNGPKFSKNEFLKLVEKKILNTELPFIKINQHNKQIPVSNCELNLITPTYSKIIRRFGTSYEDAMYKAINEALRDFVLSKIDDFTYSGHYYSVEDNKWEKMQGEIDLKKFEFVSTYGDQDIVRENYEQFEKRNLILQNDTNFQPLDISGISEESKYYYKVLEDYYHNEVDVCYTENNEYYIVLLRDKESNSLLTSSIGTNIDDAIKNSIIDAIEFTYQKSQINRMEKYCINHNNSEKKLVFIPYYNESSEIKDLPIDFGWFGILDEI